jgi:hypothetical protein
MSQPQQPGGRERDQLGQRPLVPGCQPGAEVVFPSLGQQPGSAAAPDRDWGDGFFTHGRETSLIAFRISDL